MRRNFLVISCIFFFSPVFCQIDGIRPVNIEIDGNNTQLYDQSHALIIGNSDYISGWNDLKGVKYDIGLVKKALEQNGFHVVMKENLTKEQMDKAFSEFIATYGKGSNNRLLFYYAGHGFSVRSAYGDDLGYIVPVDAPNPYSDKSGFQSKAMEMAQIEIYAKRIESKHALFMFDACFAGSLFALRDAVPEVINYKTREPVRQFITSGSAEESVPDKSIFREQFILALTTEEADSNNDGYLTGTELGTFLQNKVVNYSYGNQHPQYGKIRHSALDKGDFVFVVTPEIENEINETIIEENINRYGGIQLESEIDGQFYIDGVFQCDVKAGATYVFNKISTGVHILNIKGSDNWSEKIMIIADKTTIIKSIKVVKKSHIKVISYKTGKLYIDEIYIQTIEKESEQTINDIDPGKHIIKLLDLNQSDEIWVKDFELISGETKVITIGTKEIEYIPYDFVFIKGGTFQMGSNSGNLNEKPVHNVTVSDFYMSKYEVTQNEWSYLMGENPSFHICDKCPVERVSWQDIQIYIQKLSEKTGKNYRLPTEAEWEYAAGGGSSARTIYAGTDSLNLLKDFAWYGSVWYETELRMTNIVGIKEPNSLGLYDMSGNVSEWCFDRFGVYESHDQINPYGNNINPNRVFKGGAFNDFDNKCRISSRDHSNIQNKNKTIGFRLVYTE